MPLCLWASLSRHLISRSCEFCLKEIITSNEPQKGNILQLKHSRTCTTARRFPFTPAPKSIPKYSRHSWVWTGSHLGIMLPNAIRGYTQGNGFNLTSGTSATALPIPGKSPHKSPRPSASTLWTWTAAIPSCVRNTLWNNCPGSCHLLRCCRDFNFHRAIDSDRPSEKCDRSQKQTGIQNLQILLQNNFFLRLAWGQEDFSDNLLTFLALPLSLRFSTAEEQGWCLTSLNFNTSRLLNQIQLKRKKIAKH